MIKSATNQEIEDLLNDDLILPGTFMGEAFFLMGEQEHGKENQKYMMDKIHQEIKHRGRRGLCEGQKGMSRIISGRHQEESIIESDHNAGVQESLDQILESEVNTFFRAIEPKGKSLFETVKIQEHMLEHFDYSPDQDVDYSLGLMTESHGVHQGQETNEPEYLREALKMFGHQIPQGPQGQGDINEYYTQSKQDDELLSEKVRFFIATKKNEELIHERLQASKNETGVTTGTALMSESTTGTIGNRSLLELIEKQEEIRGYLIPKKGMLSYASISQKDAFIDEIDSVVESLIQYQDKKSLHLEALDELLPNNIIAMALLDNLIGDEITSISSIDEEQLEKEAGVTVELDLAMRINDAQEIRPKTKGVVIGITESDQNAGGFRFSYFLESTTTSDVAGGLSAVSKEIADTNDVTPEQILQAKMTLEKRFPNKEWVSGNLDRDSIMTKEIVTKKFIILHNNLNQFTVLPLSGKTNESVTSVAGVTVEPEPKGEHAKDIQSIANRYQFTAGIEKNRNKITKMQKINDEVIGRLKEMGIESIAKDGQTIRISAGAAVATNESYIEDINNARAILEKKYKSKGCKFVAVSDESLETVQQEKGPRFTIHLYDSLDSGPVRFDIEYTFGK